MDIDKIYRTLHKHVEDGFETVQVTVFGVSYVLKTLTPQENKLVKYHAKANNPLEVSMFRLAYSLFMVNGRNVLVGRPHSINDLVEMLNSIPVEVTDILRETSIQLQKRHYRYLSFAEGYALTSQSRVLWLSRKTDPTLSTRNTAIPGIEMTGTPEALVVWTLINQTKDREMENAKTSSDTILIASATNPDGAKKIANSMDLSKKNLEATREILVKYGSEAHKSVLEDEVLNKKERWTADVSTAHGLTSELERQMRGEQDKHDLFMQTFYGRLRKEAAEREKAEEERLAKVRALRGGDPHTGSFTVSDEEMESIARGEITHTELSLRKAQENRPREEGGVSKTMSKRIIGARKSKGSR